MCIFKNIINKIKFRIILEMTCVFILQCAHVMNIHILHLTDNRYLLLLFIKPKKERVQKNISIYTINHK